jgi:hypothetical protein
MKTVKLTCRYELTQAAREALALAGTPTERYQVIEIEVDAADALKRGLATVTDAGVILQDLYGGCYYGGARGETWPLQYGHSAGDTGPWQADHVLTADEAAARYEQAWQTSCADAAVERAKEEAKEQAKAAHIARAVELLRTTPPSQWVYCAYPEDVTPNPGPDHVTVVIDELPPEVRALVSQEKSRRTEEKKAQEEARAAAEAADRAAWIDQHGSDRLKKARAAGVKCEGIYRSERIALDLPGWEYWEIDVQTEDKHGEIINPTEAHLDALLAAREMHPQQTVDLWSIWDSIIDREDRVYATVIQMACPWDADSEVIRRL